MAEADAPLLVERTDDDVVIATLRNGKVNALSNRVLDAIGDAAAEWAKDPPGAVVLTGGPKLFAAGADIDQFVASDEGADDAVTLVDTDAVRSIAQAFRRASRALEALPCAVLAEVSGYALGGGCELALAADLRIASERARFGQPEILLGIIPGGGGTQRLPRLVGVSRAKELIFSGRQVKADEALAIGLADRVVAPDELHDAALAWAAELAAGPVQAIALAKAAIDGATTEQQAFTDVFQTEDATIGVQSFLEHGPGKATFTGR